MVSRLTAPACACVLVHADDVAAVFPDAQQRFEPIEFPEDVLERVDARGLVRRSTPTGVAASPSRPASARPCAAAGVQILHMRNEYAREQQRDTYVSHRDTKTLRQYFQNTSSPQVRPGIFRRVALCLRVSVANVREHAMLGAMAESAQLVIVRDHPEDIQDRPVYLWIDGEKWDGVLRYGKTFTRELPPGHHTDQGQQHAVLAHRGIRCDTRRDRSLSLRERPDRRRDGDGADDGRRVFTRPSKANLRTTKVTKAPSHEGHETKMASCSSWLGLRVLRG